jgi:uncharacterized protein (TIGR00251 family)
MNPIFSSEGNDTLVSVKAVPGARSDGITGPLGDRLKVRTSAPPEDGKANAAICRLLEQATGCVAVVERGHTSALKRIRLIGITVDQTRAALGVDG